jgi:hypothetical protein
VFDPFPVHPGRLGVAVGLRRVRFGADVLDAEALTAVADPIELTELFDVDVDQLTGDRRRRRIFGILAQPVGRRRRSGPRLEGAGETLFVPEPDCLRDLLDRPLGSAQKVDGFVATGFIL